jgi:hypothetical protein
MMSNSDLVDVGTRLWPGHDATGFNYFDFLHACGSPRAALFYSRLFWPEFLEYEGMVFLEDSIEDDDDRRRVREALAHYGGDVMKTEKSFNTIEVTALFGSHFDTTEEEDRLLVAQICLMWSARLREQFPHRRFAVEIQSPTEQGDELSVCFYQSR